MGLLRQSEEGVPFLKMSLVGFAGSGKTYTAKEIAVGIRDFFKLPGPIAMWDSEDGSGYIARDVRERTGKALLVFKGRAFKTLREFVAEAVAAGAAAAIVDSVTHPWRELCDSYLDEVNRLRESRRLGKQRGLQMQDWPIVKRTWNDEFTTTAFLNSPIHVITCGRAGFEFEEGYDAEQEKRTLTKVGIKMKAEGEFGFEAGLYAYMEPDQTDGGGNLTKRVVRKMTVFKDRFNVLDGMEFENPTFETIRPFAERLTPASGHRPVDVETRTAHDLDQFSRGPWEQEIKRREIFLEEWWHLLDEVIPGKTDAANQAKRQTCVDFFKTTSKKAIEDAESWTVHAAIVGLVAKVNAARKEGDPLMTIPGYAAKFLKPQAEAPAAPAPEPPAKGGPSAADVAAAEAFLGPKPDPAPAPKAEGAEAEAMDKRTQELGV